MSKPLTPQGEQKLMRYIITRHRRGMLLDNINGVLFLSITVNGVINGGWELLLTAIFGYLVRHTSVVLTNKRMDLTRLRQMLGQMEDGLYLKEALNEFKPAVREYMKKNFIHPDLLR